MRLRGSLPLVTALLLLSGCQTGYLIENAYYQANLLLDRVPLEKALADPHVPEEIKAKLRLAEKAKLFAETELGLKRSDNYSSYVQLESPYVVHSLTVAPKDKLEAHTWWFPFFGSFPYLGYFNQKSALKAENKYREAGYDTYLRGVTAFSTLGWFDDPILSSMLSYSEFDLVNLIIHETVHATIYIKDAVDFNERLATFIGNAGTELFYRRQEGMDSKTLKAAEEQNEDDRLFSEFISSELERLKKWYEGLKAKPSEELRRAEFKKMQERFAETARPKMKTKSYDWFAMAELNNARLLSYQTYFKDLGDFKKLYDRLGGSFPKLVEYCKSLEKSENPEETLKKFLSSGG